MSDQDFRERMLGAIEDLKRTTERIENRMERMDEEFNRTIERMDHRIQRMDERIGGRLTAVEKDVTNLHGDVRWIRGKLEGRQEATSNKDVKTAIWIALGSALAAIVSLIKSFWA